MPAIERTLLDLSALSACSGNGNSNSPMSLRDMLKILGSDFAGIPERLECLWADYKMRERPDVEEREAALKDTITICEKIGWPDLASQGRRSDGLV